MHSDQNIKLPTFNQNDLTDIWIPMGLDLKKNKKWTKDKPKVKIFKEFSTGTEAVVEDDELP